MAQLLYLSTGAQEAVERIRPWISESSPIKIGEIYGDDLYNLAGYDGLLIGSHVDQRRLAAHSDRLATYLENGGTIVANGHIAYPFLPRMTPFRPIPNYRVEDLIVRRHIAHPIWEGVTVEDLSRRRGVTGFYARGWHTPPDGAEVVHTLGDDTRPIDFIYRVGAGRVLFHGGNDFWSFDDGTTSARRIMPQLLAWVLSKGGA